MAVKRLAGPPEVSACGTQACPERTVASLVAPPRAEGYPVPMYALALIRYRRPIEEVVVHQEGHRAFQRKLQEEGVSFQQLADSVRKSIAMHYLQSGNYPVKEVSYILGYNELSAFTRAFKRWTGKTPVDFQKK